MLRLTLFALLFALLLAGCGSTEPRPVEVIVVTATPQYQAPIDPDAILWQQVTGGTKTYTLAGGHEVACMCKRDAGVILIDFADPYVRVAGSACSGWLNNDVLHRRGGPTPTLSPMPTAMSDLSTFRLAAGAPLGIGRQVELGVEVRAVPDYSGEVRCVTEYTHVFQLEAWGDWSMIYTTECNGWVPSIRFTD